MDSNLGTFGHVGGTDDQLKIILHVFSIFNLKMNIKAALGMRKYF